MHIQQNYPMSADLHMDDDQATLILANQIGMKKNCNPCLDLPVKQNKYNAAHFKLACKYFHARKQSNAKCSTPKKLPEDWVLKEESNNMGWSTLTKRNVNSSARSRSKQQSQDNLDLRVQTARTTFGRRTNIFSQNQVQSGRKCEEKSQIQQNKNLLFDIWKQQMKSPCKSIINLKPKSNISSNEPPIRSKQMKLQFNSNIKSFEFC